MVTMHQGMLLLTSYLLPGIANWYDVVDHGGCWGMTSENRNNSWESDGTSQELWVPGVIFLDPLAGLGLMSTALFADQPVNTYSVFIAAYVWLVLFNHTRAIIDGFYPTSIFLGWATTTNKIQCM